jgi:putative peptide zinc metalloprotease protein
MRTEKIRGERWYWLTCGNGKNTLRFNQEAWEIIGRCDGNQTLNAIWHNAIQLRQDACATQPETIEILQQCFEKKLIEAETSLAWANLEQKATEKNKQEFQGRFSPTGFRLDCGNPSPTIARLRFLGTIICSQLGALFWILCCIWVVSLLARNSEALSAQSNVFLMQPSSWWLMAIVFIPVKLVHELAHGLVAQHFGAHARQWGVSWMLLFPAPFIDISQASMLGKKNERILVSCAGIAAEIFIAGLALMLWQQTEPGLIRQLLLATWLTAGVSTILFNANPLMKMDGYYAMIDALELPNLAQRSAQFWQDQFLLRTTLRAASGEKIWLFLYAPASWLWRAAIFYWAFIWVGSVYRPMAFALAIAGLVQLVGKPIWNLKKKLEAEATSAANHSRNQRRYILGLVGILAIILLLPLPDRSLQKALWTLDLKHLAKARADGFVPLTMDHQNTSLTLEDPSISLQLARIESRQQALQARQQQALQSDLNLVKQLNDEMETLQSEKALFQERSEELVVGLAALEAKGNDKRGKANDPVQWINAHNLPGQWIKKGQLLGVAQAQKSASLQLVVNQSIAGRINAEPAQFFSASSKQLLVSTLERQTPMAIDELPSAGLSQARGGAIETDPLDQKHVRPLHPSFRFDLKPAHNLAVIHGTVTWVVVDFGYSIVAKQLVRGLQETIRTQFALRTA